MMYEILEDEDTQDTANFEGNTDHDESQDTANFEGTIGDVTHGDSEDWQPNFKYIVHDDELEFDELVRPAITNPEIEKHIRDLYTKANGIDVIKSKYDDSLRQIEDVRAESQRYQAEAQEALQGIEGLKKLALEDFQSFAHIVGLDDNTVLKYASNRIDYREKPEDERKRIDRDIESRATSYGRDLEFERLRKQNSDLMQRQHEDAMNAAYALPEISKFEKAFDAKLGKQGAFREHVRQYGSTQYKTNNTYVKPLDAVQAVYAQYKPLFGDAIDSAIENQNATSNKGKAGSKPARNLGPGRNATMVAKRIKSLDDLRKRANELARNEYD